jgi:glycosyltransferase involved in cell wall biosynthesis
MKFLYIAPRFHTNQAPIVEGLVNEGHEVSFLVEKFGISEDYSVITPECIEKSLISKTFFKLIDFLMKSQNNENKKMKFFIPSFIKFFNQIKDINPDVVVLRNRSFVTAYANFICKLIGCRAVLLYNQTPIYFEKADNSFRMKNFILEKIKKNIFPYVRITPVLYRGIYEQSYKYATKCINEHEYFLPFVAKVDEVLHRRNYCYGDKIRILDVGKYRDYKNHYVLVDAIKKLEDCSSVNVTIVGQVSCDEEERYYDDLVKYINSCGLSKIFSLKKNVAFNKMVSLYHEHDIFVLTSKNEIASISVLEAMANGLVVISTSANGTASYIEENIDGYIFETMNSDDLSYKLLNLISNPSKIVEVGNKAIDTVTQKYTFQSYYQKISEIVEKEFNKKIQ